MSSDGRSALSAGGRSPIGRGEPRGLLIAAPTSGAGKTTLTLALARALVLRGTRLAVGKSGPDYIDPAYLGAAARAQEPAITLDAYAMSDGTLTALAGDALAAAAPTANGPHRAAGGLLLVEGAMGLFDGAPAPGPAGRCGAAADLAAALGLGTVLVIDAARQGATAAVVAQALLRRAAAQGAPALGCILNRVGSPRHERLLRQALEGEGIRCFGAVARDPALTLPARHLGLVQAREQADLESFLNRAASAAAAGVDLDALCAAAAPLALNAAASELGASPSAPPLLAPPLGQRIAVARDDAFAFLYPHLLNGWRRAGAALSFFSPLADEAPAPDADAVYLPGGYPELDAPRLSAAERFRDGVTSAAARGAAVFGECGGYMTLGAGLTDADGRRWPMLGLLPLETSFAERRLALGYRRLEALPAAAALFGAAKTFTGHEFHYATTVREGQAAPLFRAADAEGADLGPHGLASGRVAGGFAHLISLSD